MARGHTPVAPEPPAKPVIPSLAQLLDAFDFTAKRCEARHADVSRRELNAALRRAARLAREERDEPAALFYVLAKLPGPLNETWPKLARLMATNHARINLGFDVNASPDELDDLAWSTCLDGLPFEKVRDWFRGRFRQL